MTQRESTVQFDAVLGLYDLLADTEWPALLGPGGAVLSRPKVLFDELWEAPTSELIVVTGFVDDDSIDWKTISQPSQRETFTTTVMVTTAVPNRSGREAYERLRQLVSTLSAALRNMTTGAPIIPAEVAAVGVYAWRVAAVSSSFWSSKSVRTAVSEVSIAVAADI